MTPKSIPAFLNWVFYSGSHKTEIKVSTALGSYLEVFKKILLSDSFRLLAEFSSLRVTELGSYFLDMAPSSQSQQVAY